MKRGGELIKILTALKSGAIKVEDALKQIDGGRFEDLGFARVDHGRESRCGIPEVVYAEGKSAAQIITIAKKIIKNNSPLLITRIDKKQYNEVRKGITGLTYNETAKCAMRPIKKRPKSGGILVVTAGTSDIPVAEESAVTCEVMGYKVERLFDAGVAGIHRLLSSSKELGKARVIIVVAGMEGALPSVVGGLVDVPVIAVPTSVGYGTSFGGVAALLSMLNSCASGVTVVNIDNGFGAGAAAMRIMELISK